MGIFMQNNKNKNTCNFIYTSSTVSIDHGNLIFKYLHMPKLCLDCMPSMDFYIVHNSNGSPLQSFQRLATGIVPSTRPMFCV